MVRFLLHCGRRPYMAHSMRDRIVALAARYKIPAIYPFREYAVDGGLMSYGGVELEAHRPVHPIANDSLISQQVSRPRPRRSHNNAINSDGRSSAITPDSERCSK